MSLVHRSLFVQALCSTLRAASLVAVTLAPLAAVSARADDVDLRVDNRAAPGEQPKLSLILNRDVAGATVELKSPAGSFKQRQAGKKGQTLTFVLPQKAPGTVRWQGTLTVEFADGAGGAMPLQFDTEVLSAKFRFDIKPEDLVPEEDRLSLTSERATARVEVEIYTDADELLASTGKDYAPPIAAGQPVPVEWLPKKKGDVLRVHVVVTDEKGSYQSADFFPYMITIPHEDVVFDSGKSVIRADQQGKLEATIPEIEKAVTRFGPAMKAARAEVRLFVSGHTDTVGNAGTNMALSTSRAKAIARWFADHKCPVAVYARGFGESMLKVPTDDEVDNEQNRRVDYDVGVNSPTGSLSGWTRVK